MIGEKYRPILFGLYPYDEQWRAALAMLVVYYRGGIAFPRLLAFAPVMAVVAHFAGDDVGTDERRRIRSEIGALCRLGRPAADATAVFRHGDHWYARLRDAGARTALPCPSCAACR